MDFGLRLYGKWTPPGRLRLSGFLFIEPHQILAHYAVDVAVSRYIVRPFPDVVCVAAGWHLFNSLPSISFCFASRVRILPRVFDPKFNRRPKWMRYRKKNTYDVADEKGEDENNEAGIRGVHERSLRSVIGCRNLLALDRCIRG